MAETRKQLKMTSLSTIHYSRRGVDGTVKEPSSRNHEVPRSGESATRNENCTEAYRYLQAPSSAAFDIFVDSVHLS